MLGEEACSNVLNPGSKDYAKVRNGNFASSKQILGTCRKLPDNWKQLLHYIVLLAAWFEIRWKHWKVSQKLFVNTDHTGIMSLQPENDENKDNLIC